MHRICLKEKSLLRSLSDQVTDETFLVVHPPPRGVCDQAGNRVSAGSRNLRTFIEKAQPRVVLCGHIHEQAGAGMIKKSLVVNCAMNKNCWGAILEVEKEGQPRVNFLHPGELGDMESQPDNQP